MYVSDVIQSVFFLIGLGGNSEILRQFIFTLWPCGGLSYMYMDKIQCFDIFGPFMLRRLEFMTSPKSLHTCTSEIRLPVGERRLVVDASRREQCASP